MAHLLCAGFVSAGSAGFTGGSAVTRALDSDLGLLRRALRS